MSWQSVMPQDKKTRLTIFPQGFHVFLALFHRRTIQLWKLQQQYRVQLWSTIGNHPRCFSSMTLVKMARMGLKWISWNTSRAFSLMSQSRAFSLHHVWIRKIWPELRGTRVTPLENPSCLLTQKIFLSKSFNQLVVRLVSNWCIWENFVKVPTMKLLGNTPVPKDMSMLAKTTQGRRFLNQVGRNNLLLFVKVCFCSLFLLVLKMVTYDHDKVLWPTVMTMCHANMSYQYVMTSFHDSVVMTTCPDNGWLEHFSSMSSLLSWSIHSVHSMLCRYNSLEVWY